HGTMHWVDCLDCGQRYPREDVHQKMLAGEAVPRCDKCHGILKPATVAYGQAMPERETRESELRSAGCDMLLAAGSSMVVYPAAQMPLVAKRGGARLVIINLTATPHDGHADVVINDKSGDTLHRILGKVKGLLQE
ncbi:unnamed protein product, partial [marine sediment metagenome]